MDIHKPRPWAGWREFLKEIGTIVLGVMIALGAEQLVEHWQWHEKVQAAREALRPDLVHILVSAREREAEDKCIRAKLLFLRDFINSHPNELPALGDVGSPPARPWYPPSWDSVVASNVSAHFPPDQLVSLGWIAGQSRWAEETAKREIDDWAVLYTMVGPPHALAHGEAAQIRKALTDAAFQLNTMRLIAPQISDKIVRLGLLNRADLEQVKARAAQTLQGATARHICGPALQPDSSRVDAPYDPAVQTRTIGANDQMNR